ncbi:MAG: hypothetical protein ACYTHJ_13160 [Planctomycetota bacterium]
MQHGSLILSSEQDSSPLLASPWEDLGRIVRVATLEALAEQFAARHVATRSTCHTENVEQEADTR